MVLLGDCRGDLPGVGDDADDADVTDGSEIARCAVLRFMVSIKQTLSVVSATHTLVH
jgi:hypothetical protein